MSIKENESWITNSENRLENENRNEKKQLPVAGKC